MISRRLLLSATLGTAADPAQLIAPDNPDARLLDTGGRFLRLVREIDLLLKLPNSYDPGAVRFNQLLGEVEELDAEIQMTRATTIQGLRVKAEMANWSREGDLRPKTLTLDERMAWAIVQDLIRLPSKG